MIEFTDSQFEALCALADNRGHSVTDLARKLGKRSSNISSEIKKPLEENAVIYIKQNVTGKRGRPSEHLFIHSQFYRIIHDEAVNLHEKYDKEYQKVINECEIEKIFIQNGKPRVKYKSGTISKPDKPFLNIIKKCNLYYKVKLTFGYLKDLRDEDSNKLIIASEWSPQYGMIRQARRDRSKRNFRKKFKDISNLREAHELWILENPPAGELISCDENGFFGNNCFQCGRLIRSRIDSNFQIHIRCLSCKYEKTVALKEFEAERAAFRKQFSNLL